MKRGGTSEARSHVHDPGAEPATLPYVVCWWGKFALVDSRSGAELLPRGRRAQAILAMLASRPGVPILRSELAAMFWGDRGDEQARASVRQSLAELRELNASDLPLLTIDQTSVAMVAQHVTDRTGQLDDLAHSGDAAALERLIGRGDSLLAGLDGISDAFDEWLRSERSAALEALVTAGVRTAQAAAQAGDAGAAQRLINRLQAIDPLDERLARAGFEADAAAGDAATIERRFRSLEKRLNEELAVAPSQATRDAYRDAVEKLQAPAIAPGAAEAARPATLRRFSRLHLAAAAAALLILAIAGLLALRPDRGNGASAAHTIAVIPFVATDEQKALATGVSEEIVSRLSRNPKIAPLGRASARMIGDDPTGAIALGRELRVEYLLTGKLSGSNGRLAIDAQLIRTRDGQAVWQEAYSGGASELIPLMNRIGVDVSREIGAGALPQPQRHVPVNGADQLYYRAKSLLSTGEPERVSSAVELLRQAVRVDPEYAPAWSLLGIAARHQQLQHLVPEGDPDDVLIPQAYARRGLELAPDSAEANLAMGDTLAEDPRSLPYVLRAAQLDPSDAEIWMELVEKHDKAGDFVRLKQALDRAAHIDPLSQKVVLSAASWNWGVGDRATALSQLQQLYRHGQPRPRVQHMIRGFVAFRNGDLSTAYQEFTAASASTDATSRIWTDGARASVLYAVGLGEEARPFVPFKAIAADWDLFTGKGASAASIEVSRKHPFYAWNMQERNYFLLRVLVSEGRFGEVAALYDRRFKSPEEFAATPRGLMSFLGDSVPVIIALRQTGRVREADRIRAIARAELAKRLQAGIVPDQMMFLAAQLRALDGDRAGALRLLTQAMELGWMNRANLSLPDIAEEPAFRGLRTDASFQELRNRLERLYAKERAEILAARSRNASA